MEGREVNVEGRALKCGDRERGWMAEETERALESKEHVADEWRAVGKGRGAWR